MLQKFALAFKSKRFDFFSDDYEALPSSIADKNGGDEFDSFSLLDAAEEFITDQKVLVLKPDASPPSSRSPHVSPSASSSTARIQPSSPLRAEIHISNKKVITAQIAATLLSSLFATISCFKASYLHFQSAHDPFDEEGMKAADRALISYLKKLSDIKKLIRNFSGNIDFNLDSIVGSNLDSEVQENQSMLRALEIVVNRLQSEIDAKDTEVATLKQRLEKIQRSSLEISKSPKSSPQVFFSLSFFSSVLHTACRSMHSFTKLLMELMKGAGWDLELVARSVHPDIRYSRKDHTRYALLSFVCLHVFEGFDSPSFISMGMEDGGLRCGRRETLQHVAEHISVGAMETIKRNPNGEFSQFCENKYERIIQSTMESSIFTKLEGSEVVLRSWKSLAVFYEAFVKMASSVWMLHKLALSFDPPVNIFQVEKGVAFSGVYMEDVTQRRSHLRADNNEWSVGFTVMPGFKIGNTLVQSQVYLTCSDYNISS